MDSINKVYAPDGEAASSPIPGVIMQMFKIISELQDPNQKIEHQSALQKLSDKYYDPEFRLAVIGNFSCGKSTFLNAVLGRDLLTVSDLPTTAIPTYIRWNKSEVTARLKQKTAPQRQREYDRKRQETSNSGFFVSLKEIFCNILIVIIWVVTRIFPADFLYSAMDALYRARPNVGPAPQKKELGFVPEPEPEPEGNPEDPYITVTTCQGKTYALHGNGLSRFKADTGIEEELPRDAGPLIDKLTTTNRFSNIIARIELSFPEQERYRNFCLIDTPGVNPGDEESKNHILQTQSVLREEADAAIILYPAKDAMSKDLEQFMEEHAAHLLGNAIILITKMDIVKRQAEQEKILNNTKRLVQRRFGQDDPVIYGISANMALEHLLHSQEEEDAAQRETAEVWKQRFDESLDEIFHSLRERREKIVSARISTLLTELMDAVSTLIEQDTESMIEERENIQRYSLENLMEEIQGLYDNHEWRLQSGSQIRKEEARSIALSCVRRRREQICARLQEQTNNKGLKQCVENDAKSILSGVDQEIIERVNNEVISAIEQLNSEYTEEVEDCLVAYQRHIGQVGGHEVQMSHNHLSSMSVPDTSSFLGNNATTLGLTGGALLLLPELALPALALGWLIDRVRFGSRKEEAISQMTDKLNGYGETLADECEKSLEAAEEENLIWAQNILEDYRTRYKTYFDNIEHEFRQREEIINHTISKNRQNIRIMENLQSELRR